MKVWISFFAVAVVLLATEILTKSTLPMMHIRIEKVEQLLCNPLVLESKFETGFFNRTTRTMQGYFMFLRQEDIRDDDVLNAQLYMWMSNRYIEFPAANIRMLLSTIFSMKLFGINEIINQYYHPKLVWPLKANVKYTFKGVNLSGHKIPTGFGEGKYLLKTSYLWNNGTAFMITGVHMDVKKVRS